MTPQQSVMRIMKYAFIASILLFLVVALRIPSKAVHPPQHIAEIIIIVVALVNLALGWNGRRFFAALSKANAANATPLQQWFTANVFSLALMESCALFALVLHLLGSSNKLVGFLFGCSLLTLFIWNPGAPPAPEDASGISR